MGFFDRLRRPQPSRSRSHLEPIKGSSLTAHSVAFSLTSHALTGLTEVDEISPTTPVTQIKAMFSAGMNYLRSAGLNTPEVRRALTAALTTFVDHTGGNPRITDAASDHLVDSLEAALKNIYGSTVPCSHWDAGQTVLAYVQGAIRSVVLTGRTCGLCEVNPTGVVIPAGQPTPEDLTVAICVNNDCAEPVAYKTSV